MCSPRGGMKSIKVNVAGARLSELAGVIDLSVRRDW